MFSLKIFRAALTSTNEKLNFDSCPIFQSKLDLGVKSLMTVIKPNSAVTLPINKTQYEAIKQMEKFDNGSVLVLENEKSNKVVGLYRERDYTSMVGIKGMHPDSPLSNLTFTEIPTVSENDSYLEAIKCFFDQNKRYALVTTEKENTSGLVTKDGRALKGIVTPLDVIYKLQEIKPKLTKVRTAKEVLNLKRLYPDSERMPLDNILLIHSKKKVLEALRMIVNYYLSNFVTHENGVFKGLFTQRGYCRKIGIERLDPSDISVGDVIDKQNVFVSPMDSVETCFDLFTKKKVRYLIVSDSKDIKKIKGVISPRDCLRALYVEKIDNE